MKKRIILPMAVVILLAIGLLAGCQDEQEKQEEEPECTITLKEGKWGDIYYNEESDPDRMRNVKGGRNPQGSSLVFQELGIGFGTVDQWMENGSEDILYCLYGNVDEFGQVSFFYEGEKGDYGLFAIYSRDVGESAPLFSDFEMGNQYTYAEKIGILREKEFYFVFNTMPPSEGFSQEELKDINAILGGMEQLKESLLFFPPQEVEEEEGGQDSAEMAKGIAVPDFETTDLYGNAVTREILEDYDITMVNVWATWCGPCRMEIPYIQAAYEELPENANIISICEDGGDDPDVAIRILEKVGATYLALVPDEALQEDILSFVQSIPTTFLVDREGRLVGTPMIGVDSSKDITQVYLDYIKDGLEQVNGAQ